MRSIPEPPQRGQSNKALHLDLPELFYASDVGGSSRIALATSSDGISWYRRGTVLAPAGRGSDGASVHTPCAVRRNDGSVAMWYAGLPVGDDEFGYRICSARFPGLGPREPDGAEAPREWAAGSRRDQRHRGLASGA